MHSNSTPGGQDAKSKFPAGTSENIIRAWEILRENSPSNLAELEDLGAKLKGEKEFGWARQVIGHARDVASTCTPPAGEEQRRRLRQQHALCTYKDPDLTADFRLRVALEILNQGKDLDSTTDQETLGIAGAIYKNKWQLSGQREHLERALSFYGRGYRQGVGKDRGYTAINAAFVLDLIASLEQKAAEPDESSSAAERRARARKIREEILTSLNGKDFAEERATKKYDEEWWFVAVLAEASFGLGKFADALRYLQSPTARSKAKEWELESTARQLIALSRLQGQTAGPATAEGEGQAGWKTIRDGFGLNERAMRALAIGKIGLALSGGGFRASLFHCGVFAKLAELDLLRHVDVLSCVSGGSIVGAHYYLELRHVLRTKKDADISADDYVQLVQRMIADFVAGTQTNIRTRLVLNPLKNLWMMFTHFSRTKRAAELYEKKLYARIQDGEGGAPRFLSGLTVQPKGDPRLPFKPKLHNWDRAAKVPILILNATTLNSGHNWQFTATWMGEPPSGTGTRIDRNFRLRRLWYDDPTTPKEHQSIRLGDAVGASACVPFVFAPIVLRGLYQRGVTARLVDGGVHDNQGIASLLDQDCSVMLVSDASGQMDSDVNPGQSAIPVILRAKSILETRVRAAQFKELDAREQSGLLQGLMFIHLKEGLDAEQVDWIGSTDPTRVKLPAQEPGAPTEYGILKPVQVCLAAIRTDLDSFTDTEAYALMCSGYKMTEYFLPERIRDLAGQGQPENWEFLELLPAISDLSHPGAANVLEQLEASNRLAFKVWKLNRWLRFAGKLLRFAAILLLLALLVVVLWRYGPEYWKLVLAAMIAAPIVLALLGWLLAGLHLKTFDRLFLRVGRRQR